MPFSVISFGHFTLVSRFRVFLIALDKETAATIGNNTDSSIVNFGCNIIENQLQSIFPEFEVDISVSGIHNYS